MLAVKQRTSAQETALFRNAGLLTGADRRRSAAPVPAVLCAYYLVHTLSAAETHECHVTQMMVHVPPA